jgi:hypothetical protein
MHTLAFGSRGHVPILLSGPCVVFLILRSKEDPSFQPKEIHINLAARLTDLVLRRAPQSSDLDPYGATLDVSQYAYPILDHI